MGARHSGRQAALQILFQIDASELNLEQVISLFWHHFESDPEGRSYAEQAVRGTQQALQEIDQIIQEASIHWKVVRMGRVDRNILRLGTWELMYSTQVPHAVVLNEAIELAKTFGTEESGAFVNGVLNQIAERIVPTPSPLTPSP
ncbi:transcription antitermination factor NusB [Pajaroellobacter abortibovis]|uniref:Transcription antitermination protein NusB n=1 Tax=Pajaroellobacter abortibovis TaxID=1882918 RepID=A0A1L6MVL7_9BACT|nr:transcription antitermination factor NusB [Pajaroellobacter abortibovis]APR99528.1 transcription antitermination factor NusB [Pajaroellobacter abortibovis]